MLVMSLNFRLQLLEFVMHVGNFTDSMLVLKVINPEILPTLKSLVICNILKFFLLKVWKQMGKSLSHEFTGPNLWDGRVQQQEAQIQIEGGP